MHRTQPALKLAIAAKKYVTKQHPISRQKIKIAIPPQDVMLPPVVLYVSIYR